YALRQEIGRDRNGGINRPGTTRSADADTAHRLDSASYRHLVLTGHDFGGGEIHRIEAGSTKAVDLHTRDAVAEAGNQCRRARNISTCFAYRIYTAKHDIVDESGIELVAVLYGRERLRGEVERGHLVQRSVGFAAPSRATDVIVDECLGHGFRLHFLGCRETGTGPRAARAPGPTAIDYRLLPISPFMTSVAPAEMRKTRASPYMREIGYSSIYP